MVGVSICPTSKTNIFPVLDKVIFAYALYHVKYLFELQFRN